MLRYTLRQIEYFAAATEHASIAKAANRLNVSQPSISAALAKLEDQLGAQLLIRHHAQGVSPSPAGRRLIAAARSLLVQADEFQRQARAEGGAIAGTLQLACFPTLAPAYLPALIAGFGKLHPQVTIASREGAQDSLIESLRAGRDELALLYDLDIPDDIECRPLASPPPYVLLPVGHRLARREPVSLHDLVDLPMILLAVPPSRRYFLSLFEAHGLAAKIAFESSSLELVRGLVGQGLGYSILVTRPHGDTTYDGATVRARAIRESCATGSIALARLKQLRPTRAMAAFEAFCVDFFQ